MSNIEYLKEKGVINGCGGKGAINLSLVIKDNIALFKEYLPEKGITLISDIEKLCYKHDVDYTNGNTFIARITADYIFAYKIYLKLHWTSLMNRLGVFLLVFIGLLKYGGKYYNYGNKKNYILKL